MTPTINNATAQQRDAGYDESLVREQSGIELRNVRNYENKTLATVFVPDGKLLIFFFFFVAYLDESKDKKNGPAHSKLLNAISQIRAATIQALWTDSLETLPANDAEHLWWEVWLPTRGDRQRIVEQFREMATGLNFSWLMTG